MLFGSTAKAQNTNTMYFMDEIAERNNLNPAFIPNCDFYFDFIFLPNFYLSAGNNDFILRDFLYNKNNTTQSILSSTESKDKFFNSLKKSSQFHLNANFNILSFGFGLKEKHYITFDMGVNLNARVGMPRDIFRLALYGTPDKDGINTFDLSRLRGDAMLYSNVNVGYMNRINDKWTVGGKAKFLMGYASVNTAINQSTLETSTENWTLKSQGRINASLPVDYQVQNGAIVDGSFGLQPTNEMLSVLYKPSGYGAAFDIGATYEPIENLVISASITDLGFIHWNKNLITGDLKGEYSFEGIDFVLNDDGTLSENSEEVFNGLADEFVNSIDVKEPNKAEAYTQMLYANFFVGAEYGILDNKISFGALSRTQFKTNYISEEVTLSTNFRPADWFKASLSYSFVDGRWGTIGLGLNLRMGMFNTYIMADYIPLSWANVHSTANNMEMPLPFRLQQFNLQAGCSWNLLRNSSDKDNDGIRNRKDKCKNTDIDFLRKACNTDDKKTLVDEYGCDLDDDKDGIINCLDQCPNTPTGVAVDTVGCPLDGDKDGIADYMDKCPNTVENVGVDSLGCPLDDDKDGIANYLDKCADTPAGVAIDENGCPVDTDKDGVADYLDKCANTPIGVKVDENGCPLDDDVDGVPNYMDECPNTPKNVEVDLYGCPVDLDGDGVLNIDDMCPNKPGPASNQGCPELKREVEKVIKKALHGIQFETGKATIKKSSNGVLDQIVAIMDINPEYLLTVKGHTDNVGSDAINNKLSQERAQAVVDYLIKGGVDASRLTAIGYGESKPVATNKTSKGRAINRRVELEVNYKKIFFEKVQNPELMDE